LSAGKIQPHCYRLTFLPAVSYKEDYL